MKWGLVIGNRAKRKLRRLAGPELKLMDDAFSQMRDNPYFGDVQFLKGSENALRRRIGDWRIFYDLEPEHKVIVVTAVKRRGSNTY
jgi:mRNA-degrading endonuclease RelE of RelBE toxin-antitoxin system